MKRLGAGGYMVLPVYLLGVSLLPHVWHELSLILQYLLLLLWLLLLLLLEKELTGLTRPGPEKTQSETANSKQSKDTKKLTFFTEQIN